MKHKPKRLPEAESYLVRIVSKIPNPFAKVSPETTLNRIKLSEGEPPLGLGEENKAPTQH